MSFDKKVRYFDHWKHAFISIILIMMPFLIWDILVTGRHWYFNEQHVLPFRFFGLPAEEMLFFVSVPFACLFIWQIIVTSKPAVPVRNGGLLYGICAAGVLATVFLILSGKIYAATVCAALATVIPIDRILKTRILSQRRTARFILILTGLILIFNGYLTARPVVLYNPEAITGIRIWTIPLEDFGYGYVLILLNAIVFERLKRGGRHV